MSFKDEFEQDVKKLIESLSEKKDEILDLWQTICDNGVAERDGGNDVDNRSLFVNLQALIENTITTYLLNGSIKGAVGVIHTPKPATPLRTDAGSDESITNRAVIIRKYLHANGEMYAAYLSDKDADGNPLVGMDIYQECLEQYSTLHDVQLKDFDATLTGASYIFGNSAEDNIFFSLKAYQMYQEEPFNLIWCIWFGQINLNDTYESPDDVQTHFQKIDNFLRTEGDINIGDIYKNVVDK